jgi:hypothetical protein
VSVGWDSYEQGESVSTIGIPNYQDGELWVIGYGGLGVGVWLLDGMMVATLSSYHLLARLVTILVPKPWFTNRKTGYHECSYLRQS